VPPAPHTPIDLSAPSPAQPAAPSLAGNDVVTALDARLAELQAAVAALVDKAVDTKLAASPAMQAAGEFDPDILESSRTLQLAKRTADATIADANTEAASILSAAHAEREVLIKEAHEAVEVELGTQRAKLAEETSMWESRRLELIDAFQHLDAELAQQRSRIDEARAAVEAALSGKALSNPIPTASAGVESSLFADLPSQPATETAQPAEPVEPAQPAAEEAPVVEAPEVPTFAAAPEAPATDVPPPPVFGDPVPAQTFEAAEPVAEGVTFGTPPEPPATPFYPWSNDDQQQSTEPGAEPAPAEDPKPVQRRGLFGH
jgi:hypothetical protein